MPDTLLTPFEHEGMWWKPDVPEEKISGTLNYDPVKGCNLSLLGQFSGSKGTIGLFPKTLATIHGITKDSGAVTLLNNLGSGFQIKVPGISTQRFLPSYVFMGEHIDSPETFVTSRCEFRLTNLKEWLDHRPFNIQLWPVQPKVLDLTVLLPEQQSFSLPHILSTLKVNASYKTSGGSMREFSVEVLSWLILEPTQPQTLQAYLDIISRIRNLVALCLGERVYVSELVLRGEEEEVIPGKTQKRRIECFYQQNPSPIVTERNNVTFCVTIDDLGQLEGEVINKWLSLYDDIAPSLDIMFSVLHTEMYLDVRFLLIAQSIEALHRHLWPSNYVDEKQYEEIEENLVASIPDEVASDLKAKLTGVLKYGNEFSLRRRLKEISQKLNEKEAGDIVPLDSEFINDVVNTRNYLTHYDKALYVSAKRGKELYRLYAKLALTIMVVVFMELDTPKELIMEKLKRHRLFGPYVGT